MIDLVALALFASDGMKIAQPGVTLEQSWDMTPEFHTQYRERAIVFLKVMAAQMEKLADAGINGLSANQGE